MRSNRRRGPVSNEELEDLGTFDSFTELGLPAAAAEAAEATAEQQIAQAEKELDEVRVNFRWGRRQLELVKRAAAAAGIPYQIYIKHVLFEHAVADLEKLKAVGE